MKRAEGSIGVIGAGIIGLATARLAQSAGWAVTIYAELPPDQSTSAKAAASFKPSGMKHDERNARIMRASVDEFRRIARESPDAGVRPRPHWEASNEVPEPPWYLEFMEDPLLFEGGVPGGYKFGWRYTTFFIDVPIFLAWLGSRFAEGGGKLIIGRTFTSLDEMASLPHEVLFNCTGIGARQLCGDQSVVPVRGQIVVVGPQPDMDWSINHAGFYAYPRRFDTVLGGTREPGVWDESVEESVVEAILEGNRRILPHLKRSDVKATYAGLRPSREAGIRLELQEVNGKPMVHDYGHGGAGITMCWGSAQAALDLVI